MPQVSYTVTATLPDEPTRDRFLAWLFPGHTGDVLKAGASSACVVRIDDPARPIRVQARYTFANPAALDDYLTRHAPRLRAQGLAAFPPETGIVFSREIGSIL